MDSQRETRGMRVISFSGIDGAGKSTQIERLCASLEQTGLSVRVIRFWDDVAALARFRGKVGHAVFRGDQGVGTPEVPINRRDKNVQSCILTVIRLCMYLADAISLRMLVKRAQRTGVEVLIFDRYIYDELANLKVHLPAMRAYARAMMGIVPKPDISYLLDADPVAARQRKPEYPLEFLDFNRKSYFALHDCFGVFHVLPASAADDVEREALQVAFENLSLAKHSPAPETETLSAQTSWVR